jgi:heme-degrading monooxygenase HmoA
MMVITVLEAVVVADQAARLQETFQEAVKNLDPGLVRTSLLHSLREPDVWQIVTTWETRAALDAMRQSGETPRGVLIFREAGAEPALKIYDVVVDGTAD